MWQQDFEKLYLNYFLPINSLANEMRNILLDHFGNEHELWSDNTLGLLPCWASFENAALGTIG